MDETLKEFLNNGKYLPEPVRDFHDQKRVFKRVNEIVENRRARAVKENRVQSTSGLVGWIDAHVYTIDTFLWFMASHGYTLQRSRKRVPFCSLDATMEDWQRRHDEQLRQLFAADQLPTKEGT